MKNQVTIQTAYDIEKDHQVFRLTIIWNDVVYSTRFTDQITTEALSDCFQDFTNLLKESLYGRAEN